MSFTPFRIEDAQSASPSPLITAHKVGVLNEKRCIIRKGGIGIKKEWTSDSAFEYFRKNSKMRLLTDSSRYGVIFELILNPDIVESPYYSIRSNDILRNQNTSIRNIIYKICLIKDDSDAEYYSNNSSSNSMDDQSKYLKLTVTTDDFISEVKTQMDIYNKSNKYFEPICPSIVYSKIYNIHTSNVTKKDDEFYQDDKKDKSIASYNNIFEDVKLNKIPKFGIIAMEYICNGVTVGDLDIKTMDNILPLVLYEHLRLFKLGYFHGDFHLFNVLYCDNYPYTKTIDKRVVLIDYGTTFKVPKRYKNKTGMGLKEFTNILLDNASPLYGSDFRNRNHEPYNEWITKAQELYKNKDTVLKNIEKKRSDYIRDNRIPSTYEYNSFTLPSGTIGGSKPQNIKNYIEQEQNNELLILTNLENSAKSPSRVRSSTQRFFRPKKYGSNDSASSEAEGSIVLSRRIRRTLKKRSV